MVVAVEELMKEDAWKYQVRYQIYTVRSDLHKGYHRKMCISGHGISDGTFLLIS